MRSFITGTVVISIMAALTAPAAFAETRRDGGDAQASKKAQYMIRSLHKEKQELQAKLATLQADHDKLQKAHDKTLKSLEKSSESNDGLVSRLKSTTEKYKELADRYRDAVGVLRQANQDNQYMVRAVQEREEWMMVCNDNNRQLFDANDDLLSRYSELARDDAEPVFGTGIVQVENEVQDYQFKLEDLQVTRFKPTVDVATRTRKLEEADAIEDEETPKLN